MSPRLLRARINRADAITTSALVYLFPCLRVYLNMLRFAQRNLHLCILAIPHHIQGDLVTGLEGERRLRLLNSILCLLVYLFTLYFPKPAIILGER